MLKTSNPAEEETEAVYKRLCLELGIKKAPRLLMSNTTDSPAAFGYFRRYIVLPEIPLSLSSLELTLSHELTHVKRGDLFVKLLSVAARVFHWFNPIVHYAAKRCETECELSCDEAVLRGRGDEVRTEYGETLIDILKFCRRRSGSLTTHFSPDKKTVKARLGNILYGTGKHRGILIIALCLVLCVIAGGIIGYSFGKGGKAPATDTDDTQAAESESVAESGTEPAPDEPYEILTALETTDENLSKYSNVITCDASTWEYNFSLLIAVNRDVENFAVTRLTWSEDIKVESEETVHTIGNLKAGDALLLTVDTVETIGYTGIYYEADGKTHRACPATSGKDGTPILWDIEGYLSPEFNTAGNVIVNIQKNTYTW